MINFLHSELKPKVSSSCVCEDNYEASNLITSGPISQGFMAFSVIKPPINLTFDFPSPIEIHKIKIWSSLGSLKSTGFEIKIKKDNDLDYIKVGHVSNLLIDDVVTFCRHPTSSLDKQIQFFTYKLSQDILNETSSMLVTIKSTKKCPPVIRKIEIWGLPSRCVNKGIKENIHRIWDEILYPRGTKAEKVQQSKIQKNTTSSLLDNDNIPEDFLDQITCEIMTFPMTLPSGKFVDQSTIEKHSHIEEKWGRLPSDPFTGQIFTNIRKPLLNLVLKSRIERYLLENSNSDIVQILPRTLGKSICTNKRKIETFIPSTMDNNNTTTITSSTIKRLKIDTTIFTKSTTIENDIKSALKNITRYNQPLIFNNTKLNDDESCINCNNQDNLYKIITCKHIICKICLNTFCKDKICSCKNVFKTSDVEKYNI